MNEYWFDITGKVYADNPEQAQELLYRYGLGAYNDIKIKEIEMEGQTK